MINVTVISIVHFCTIRDLLGYTYSYSIVIKKHVVGSYENADVITFRYVIPLTFVIVLIIDHFSVINHSESWVTVVVFVDYDLVIYL